MKQEFYDALMENPIVAAVKDMEGLKKCLELSDVKVVFILFGDICTIGKIVEKAKMAGKQVLVHLDLISGIGTKEVVVDYIKENTKADGIITTRSSHIKRAKDLGICTVLRFFVIDSMAFANVEKQVRQVQPDVIEILPGVMPKVIKRLSGSGRYPVIAGGLIMDREDVVGALDAGAACVSTTNQDVWKM